MRKTTIGLLAGLVLMPTFALAQEGAAAGAITGAVAGGVIGGPVGAAVGAGVGGIAGGAAGEASRRPDTVYVERDRGPGCATRTTRTENAYGESKTVKEETCD